MAMRTMSQTACATWQGALMQEGYAPPRYDLKLWIGSGDGSAAYLPG
jgi:hypothetical protein